MAVALGLFLLALYLFVYRGGFHSVDEVSMFAVTESLVKFGRVNTDQIAWTQWTTTQAEAQGFFGADGHVYSKKGLAISLAQAPLYALALLLPGLGMLQTVSLLNALLTALTAMLLLMFLWRMDFSPAASLVTALIFGAATIAFVYAKYLFSEPLAGFLLLLAVYMLFAWRQEGGLRHIVIAGLAAGFAVMARANNLFLLPAFGLYLLWIAFRRAGTSPRALLPPLLAFGLALAVPGAMLLGYNALRSGNPLQTGYDLSLFSSNALIGFYKLLFSPLRGLFIYTPIFLLSLPGWWRLRRRFPAESWLCLALVGITLALFSVWSSGEGLSWGSRFLVPLAPFFALCLAPVVESITNTPRQTHRFTRLAFFGLLLLSLMIQLLGVAINPWVSLARLQADFGGEFFLEKTAAMYDFRYSQIWSQLQNWSAQSSDLVWWQPWGFDGLAFGLSLALLLLTGWHLCRQLKPGAMALTRPALLLALLITAAGWFLLARYARTDLQFGPPDDGYTAMLTAAAAQAAPSESVLTVAQYHYHVPMNRFKARVPLIGMAQQTPPPPDTALPLLTEAAAGPNTWLVTVGFPPAAPDNATEQWLATNLAKISDDWGADSVRLVRFTALPPTASRPITATFGGQIQLDGLRLTDSARPNTPLPVEFTFRAFTPPTADYTIFLQLLNIEGQVAAQTNSPPVGGYTPTSGWSPGQAIISRHALPLPPAEQLPPGDYRLIAGLFDPVTGQRLATAAGPDFVELGNIEIINYE